MAVKAVAVLCTCKITGPMIKGAQKRCHRDLFETNTLTLDYISRAVVDLNVTLFSEFNYFFR